MGQEYSQPVPEPEENKLLFNAFRMFGVWPTLYPSHKTAVTVDVLEAGLILAFVMLAFCFYIVLPGIRGKERFYCFVRITVSLFLGACIILCNWGQEWEYGKLHTRTQYKAFSTNEIEADISIKIGLRNVNITLKAVNEEDNTDVVQGERINYNERFWWSYPWSQGRIGFGPYAAQINQEFREAQYKGLPYPILWIAEYFTLDGEGIRWGRHYRTAGWYTHIMLWTAFPCWILANILFFFNPRIGAWMTMLTGGLQLIGNICFASIRNVNPLIIPFEDGKIQPFYGWCFWLNLVSGVLCVFIGAAIIVLDYCSSESVATFFGVDVLKDYEEWYPEMPQESVPEAKAAGSSNGAGSNTDAEKNGHGDARRVSSSLPVPQFRKRGPTLKKPHIKKPVAPPRPNASSPDASADPGDGLEMYENVGEHKNRIPDDVDEGHINVALDNNEN